MIQPNEVSVLSFGRAEAGAKIFTFVMFAWLAAVIVREAFWPSK